MPVESASDLAAFFNADEFGQAASYTPPGGGGATACTVLIDAADREVDMAQGRGLLEARVLDVRAAEIAAPAKGGTFTVGAQTLTVIEHPQARDPDRLIWTMRVR